MRGFQELATVNRKMDVLLKDIIKNKAEVLKKINQEKKRQMQQAIKIQVKQQMKIEKVKLSKMRRKQLSVARGLCVRWRRRRVWLWILFHSGRT